MGVIVYNGKSSQDYSILVEHPPGYEYPEKDLIVTHVPGRNGDIVYDNDSYKNVDREYEVAVPIFRDRFEDGINKISEWLHSATGYARLEDSYEPEYFRLATYKESNIFECLFRQAGRAKIKFNCKPQRFLKIGQEPIFINVGTYRDELDFPIHNPTNFKALPLIRLKLESASRFSINGHLIEILEPYTSSEIVIDSTVQDCYSKSKNVNDIIKMEQFPYFQPGVNRITAEAGTHISYLEIIPNWWTL